MHFQLFLNYLDNYLPDKWNFRDGCTACAEDTVSLDKLKVTQHVIVCPVFIMEESVKNECQNSMHLGLLLQQHSHPVVMRNILVF